MLKIVRKKILVISQYFYPELFRINDICVEWVKRGYDLTVVTAIPNYPSGKFFDGYGVFKKRQENYHGVKIIRLPIIPRGKSSVTLALNYLSFVVSGFFWFLFTSTESDFVFIFEVSPMTQALPGVWFAKKRKIPCYLYVQDLWPENVEIMCVKNRHILNQIGRMVDYIYKHCSRIFTTSKSFVESIHGRGVSKDKLIYWPQYAEVYQDIEIIDENLDFDQDEFRLIFTGNIGKAQGLDILLQLAEKLQQYHSDNSYKFVLVGDGRYKSELVQKVKSSKLEKYFYFVDRKKPEQIPGLLKQCDVSFISLEENEIFSKTIPAKLQTYMSCAMPVLGVAKGETRDIILSSQCGLVSKPGDIDTLLSNFIQLSEMDKPALDKLGNNAKEYSSREFDKRKLMDYMDTYFN